MGHGEKKKEKSNKGKLRKEEKKRKAWVALLEANLIFRFSISTVVSLTFPLISNRIL
jgi:hypothetical protein